MTTTQPSTGAPRRVPLTRERVLQAAIKLADEGGIEALSMRKLGQELGVEAMALYHHFTGKEQVLDGIIDLVFAEIDVPEPGPDWRGAMRRRALSLRDALARHRWSIGMMESRTNPGPATLRHHDAVLGSLRSADFSVEMAAHAYSVLDSYIYGFALTKMSLPFEDTSDIVGRVPDHARAVPGRRLPEPPRVHHRARHASPATTIADEFEYGLDLILDGLERAVSEGRRRARSMKVRTHLAGVWPNRGYAGVLTGQ